MNTKTYKVIKGYSELSSEEERKEVRELIDRYEKTGYWSRDTLIKGLSESVGPLDRDTCPCCGK